MDPEGKRCFIMPLDREAVLPPRSLMDLVNKMRDGYYEVDMDTVKQNMRVVLPPLHDFSMVGVYIARECQRYPTYMLEKIVGGGKYIHFNLLLLYYQSCIRDIKNLRLSHEFRNSLS